MLQHALKKVFGDRNQRLLKNIGKTVERINAMEPEMSALDDQALAAKTGEFRARIKDGADKDDLLVEAFAVVREASVRTLGLRHFDVQLVGGVVLNSGKIAEMKTGEGKTLVATLPVYLNALSGEGGPRGHRQRLPGDGETPSGWAKIYKFLGLTRRVSSCHGLDDAERKSGAMAYQSVIVYGTNNEYGFDYLRDNMKFTARGHACRAAVQLCHRR